MPYFFPPLVQLSIRGKPPSLLYEWKERGKKKMAAGIDLRFGERGGKEEDVLYVQRAFFTAFF